MEGSKKGAALVLNGAVCELQQIADLCDMISLFRDRLTAQAEALESIVLARQMVEDPDFRIC